MSYKEIRKIQKLLTLLTVTYVTLGILCLVAGALSAHAKTVKYPKPGGGYTEITTDAKGNEVSVTNMNEDGQITDVTETDPETGTVTKTTYKKGKPESRTTTKKDGSEKVEIMGENGKYPVDVTTYDTDSDFESHTKYEYDKDGNITKITKLDKGGNVIEETIFTYKNGKLESATRYRPDKNGVLQNTGTTFYDKDGKLLDSIGTIDGITAGLPGGTTTGDTRTHRDTDTAGNTSTIRHNEDGSITVTVRDKYGRIISLQHFSSGGCPMGDKCPLEHLLKPEPKAAETTTSANTTTPGVMFNPTDSAGSPYAQLVQDTRNFDDPKNLHYTDPGLDYFFDKEKALETPFESYRSLLVNFAGGMDVKGRSPDDDHHVN